MEWKCLPYNLLVLRTARTSKTATKTEERELKIQRKF